MNYAVSNTFGKYYKNPKLQSDKPELNDSIKILDKKDKEYIYDKFINILALTNEGEVKELSFANKINILTHLKYLNKKPTINYKLQDSEKDFFNKINEKIKWLKKNNFIELKTEKYKNNRYELEENEIYVISKYLNSISKEQYSNIDKFTKRLQKTLNIYNKYLIEKNYYKKFYDKKIKKTIQNVPYFSIYSKINDQVSNQVSNQVSKLQESKNLSKDIHNELAIYFLVDFYYNPYNHDNDFFGYFLEDKQLIPDTNLIERWNVETHKNEIIKQNNKNSIDEFNKSLKNLDILLNNRTTTIPIEERYHYRY